MTRQLIDRNDLLKMINDHLESLHDCRNLHISAVVQDQAFTHGANWTTSGLRRSGNDNNEVVCKEAIASFMRDLQASYDIQ